MIFHLNRAIKILMLGIALGFFMGQMAFARHRCPKPELPNQFLITTLYSPMVTTTTAFRVFNTSGCDAGHPSDKFYKPKGATFLEQTQEQLVAEASQGQGEYLAVLARFAGCPVSTDEKFALLMKDYFSNLFPSSPNTIDADTSWQRLLDLIPSHPQLADVCARPS